MPLVEIKQLTQTLNVTEQWIGKLVKEGMPKEARGKYDLGKCMLWYIRYLQAALRRRSGATGESGRTEQTERLRLLSAEAELKELELARERGEFAAITDFEKVITELVVTTKARILAIPSRLAPQLVGEDRLKIESRLEKELKETLSTLSKNGHKPHGNTSERVDKILTAK
jgi:phage terminase Nu1 subunit (DNA packaging protein)